MEFDVKLADKDIERYWKCESGKKRAYISALIGFVGDDVKQDFISATISATLSTAYSHNWHFQGESVDEMLTTPVFRTKESYAISPITLFFECEDCSRDDCFSEGDSIVLRVKRSGSGLVHEFKFVFTGEEWHLADAA